VLVGFGAKGSAPSVVAQEASPEAIAARCPSPLATPTAAPVATPAGEAICVGVSEGEYYVRPELTTFQVGQTYIFAVGNEGQEVHEFVIEPAGPEEEAALEAEEGAEDDEDAEDEENGEEREAEIEDIAPGQTAELSGRLPSRATSSLPATCWTTTKEGWWPRSRSLSRAPLRPHRWRRQVTMFTILQNLAARTSERKESLW
jgi:uncharacterized cupredoxin-like copper-binding protein